MLHEPEKNDYIFCLKNVASVALDLPCKKAKILNFIKNLSSFIFYA
jgi:hypothetical protein